MAEPSKPYKVHFHWKNDSKGVLKKVSCDEENIPGEGWSWGQLGHIFSSSGLHEACLTVKQANTLQPINGGFLYMDVGCWLDNQQTFGLICAGDAAVCGFEYAPEEPVAGSSGKSLLDRFAQLPGISVHFREKVQSPTPAPDHLYLILPDMHVPDSPPLGYRKPVNDGTWDSTHYGAWDVDPRAFDTQTKHDLFNSRASIPAMIRFLSLVQSLTQKPEWKGKITLVQLGDMYELWAGRECEFIFTPPDQPGIIMKPKGAEFVSWYLGYTHHSNPELFHAFDRCAAQGINMLFLHGNHDNYLSCPEVVQRANAYIKSDPISKNDPASTVHPRRKEIDQDGLFIEHGQRCDLVNRDGATEGFKNCNIAANHHFLKALGPVERATFVVGAATKWCVENGKFGVYVMGHTHEADLKRVEVYHQREGSNLVAGPRDVRVQAITATPLKGTK